MFTEWKLRVLPRLRPVRGRDVVLGSDQVVVFADATVFYASKQKPAALEES